MKSPADYLTAALDVLFEQLPRARDGNAEAIHDARVATRRIRGALPVVAPTLPRTDVEVLQDIVRTAGRAFGKARDVDVAIDLVEQLERRTPRIARSLAGLRCELLEDRVAARRRLVKKIDDLPLKELHAVTERIKRPSPWRTLANGFGPSDRHRLAIAVREQARSLHSSVVHGSGVYFPKRSHATRIDVKRLRYLLEIALPLPPVTPDRMKVLKKTQSVLGNLHDREVLRKRLDDTKEHKSGSPLPILLQAECATLHAQFLKRRDDLLELCAEVKRSADSSSTNGLGAALLGAGTVAAAAWVISHHPRPAVRQESASSPESATGEAPGVSVDVANEIGGPLEITQPLAAG